MAVQNASAEIWGKIFELSCTDGGRTGRSLALVSHYIHAVSRPYRYQSIFLVGPRAIENFATLLSAGNLQSRRVKYLFVSTFKPDPTILKRIFRGPLKNHKYPPSLSHPTDAKDPRPIRVDYDTLSDLKRILKHVAPTVLNLHILMDFYREEIFFSTPFAVLEELAIQGPFDDHDSCNAAFCDTLFPPIPSLRKLYLTDVFTCAKDRTYLAIRHYAPYLTHLKIHCAEGYVESGRLFLKQLMPSRVEQSREEEFCYQDTEDTKPRRPHFPESLEHILFYPGTTRVQITSASSYMILAMRQAAFGELEKCAEDDPRITLFAESPWECAYSREYGYIIGEKQWLDNISGGVDGWEEDVYDLYE